MNFIYPEWPAPPFVKACTTCAPDHGLSVNYSLGLKDSPDPNRIAENRQCLQKHFNFKHEPWWLNQTHSADCLVFPRSSDRNGDASLTQLSNHVLAILTADCLPILLCHKQDREVAAIHAGWRGLYQGILENTLNKLSYPRDEYLAWLGPAICESCYGVDEHFKQQFCQKYHFAESCFIFRQQWHFNLSKMAALSLNQLGVQAIFHSNLCTFENSKFYSYRREPGHSGRIASLIWMEEHS